jgi:phage terminase large subunit-like protein
VSKLVLPKNKLKLEENSKKFQALVKKSKNEIESEESIFKKFPPILFPYQQEIFKAYYSDKYKLFISSKARRIGYTWGLAALAVLEASKQKQAGNFYYISVNLNLAREFIDCCSAWTKHFQIAATDAYEELYADERTDILSLRINFSSGKKIVALSSQPTSVRGLQGNILLDEFAFLENQQEFLDAVQALMIWGNKLFVVSTHNGEDNLFNDLCKKTDAGELPYFHHKVTFKQAINQGLYKRICLVTGEEWTEEKENEWIKKIYSNYGSGAAQELDAIPATNSINTLFHKEKFKLIEPSRIPQSFDNVVLAWDTAATANANSCYTVAILLGKVGEIYYILNWYYCKKDAASTNKFILETCQQQNKYVPIYIEIEGGSQSLLWLENSIKPQLKGHKVFGSNPSGSKLLRAVPAANKVNEGRVFVKDCEWTEEFLNIIKKFEGKSGVPLVTDTGDALSLAFTEIDNGIKTILNAGSVRRR